MNNFTNAELMELLSYSNFNPDDYDDWIKAGCILNDYDDNAGFDVWDEWSAQSSKYDPEETAYKWGTFKGNGGKNLTIGTLIKQAKSNGYKFTSNNEEFDWDDFIGGGEERIKQKMAKRKAEPIAERRTATKTQVNNTTIKGSKDEEELEKIIKALEAETGTFKTLIDNSMKTAEQDPQAQAYYKARSISKETREHYNAGWSINLGNPPTTGALIPGSFEGFGQRNVDYEEQVRKIDNSNLSDLEKKNAKARLRKYNKPRKDAGALDIPVGLKHVIKQPELKNPKTGYIEPIFIFEGYFDVLSLYEATGLDGISLNGIANISKIIDVLKHYGINRPIILALDNDQTGKNKNEKRYNELKDAGFTVYWSTEFYGDYKDANEFLQKDKVGFIEKVNQNRNYFYEQVDKDFNRNYLERFKEHVNQSKNRPDYPTGFKTLDSPNFLNGGLQTALYGIGAISSLGKTSFVLQIADNLAYNGIPVLYFSLEMSRYELMAKSISRYTYENSYIPEERSAFHACTTLEILDAKRQKNFSQAKLEFIEDCTDLYFKDTGDTLRIIEAQNDLSVDDIREEVKLQVDATGQAPVVILDYLQLLNQAKDVKHAQTDKQLLDENMKKLKWISRDYNTPVIFISSFNRQNSDKEGEYKSFMGSAGIEYSADVLISLERNITLTEKQKASETKETFFYKQNTKRAKIRERETGVKWLRARILKNRNGSPNGLVGLKFDSSHNLFIDYGEIYEATGTTEKPEEEAQRHDDILKGKTTIQESPEPPEVNRLI